MIDGEPINTEVTGMGKYVATFETGDDGKPSLRSDQSLYPRATYELAPSRGYVPDRLKDKEAVADWVRNAVIGDLETLNRGIAHRVDPHAGGGNFLLLIGCMMAIEYFATIFDGASKRAVKRAVSYAHEFFTNPRYVACMPLLMTARNGIAHGSWPARVQIAGKQYPFAVGYDYPESCVHLHLSLHQAEHETKPTEKLFVNPRIMLADLIASVIREEGGFRRWILDKSDAEAVKRAQPSLIHWSETDLSEWT